MFFVHPRQTHSMRTRDGLRLDADVYFPMGDGPFPILLMRQPYGRAIASTIVYAHPRWYAAHGYIVVIQDVRGRGTSEGDFQLFAHEVADGEDTLHWASSLPHSDGQIGMYGFSYQGMTQLQAAQTKVPALKTIVPAMTGYHLYEDWAYENGALCLQLGLTWAVQLAAETARLKKDIKVYQTLTAAAHNLPLRDSIPAHPDVLAGIESFFHDWVAHPKSDCYWAGLTPQLTGVDLPTLHIGGWFDPYLRGDVRLYRELSSRSQQLHHIWVGPWGHIPWGRKVGEIDFGPAAVSPVDQLQIQWFDRILKGKALGEAHPQRATAPTRPRLLATHPVCLFEMGRNQWRYLSAWPEPPVQTYFLQSDGLTNIQEGSGQLLLSKARTAKQDMQVEQRVVPVDNVVHDPWNPAPALGGHSAIPPGSFERTAIDSRGDVLTYTSEPLASGIDVAGIAKFVGEITASTPSYDLCAILSRVSHGKVHNLTQGYRRVENTTPDSPATIEIPLHPTCFSLADGESLRLSLSLACFPAYPINPGTGTQPDQTRQIEAQIITVELALGKETATQLQLPVLPLKGNPLSA